MKKSQLGLLAVISLPLVVGALMLVPVPRIATAQEEQGARISERALKQIQSLVEEKESRTREQKKIDSQLLYAVKQNRRSRLTDEVAALEVNVGVDVKGAVEVDIEADVDEVLLGEIRRLGGEVIFASEKFTSIRARMTIDSLEILAASEDVKFISPADRARTHGRERSSPGPKSVRAFLSRGDVRRSRFDSQDGRVGGARVGGASNSSNDDGLTNVGAVASQGDATHRAAEARAAFGAAGAGVKIGVLSDGVDSLAALQSAGELPTVTVLPGQAGNGSEGTAMLEIIHDLAPSAELFFATAFNGQASFAQNILNLRAAGCDIIVDDVAYFREAVFQDDAIARAVEEVSAGGALYFSSAGNEGNENDGTSGVWEGDFVDGGAFTVGGVTRQGSVHNFGAGTSNQLTNGNGGAPIGLFWSDPLGGSGNDYDLYVLNSTLTTVIGAATNVQDGNDNPVELSSVSPSAGSRLVILKKPQAAVRALHLNTFRGRLAANTPGQIHGHAAAASAFAVAAVPAGPRTFGAPPNPVGPFPNAFSSNDRTELFSSDGPRRIFFNSNGTAITPGNFLFASGGGVVRQKPDIAAADGVSTATPGFGTFFGTSAAAPHAAAVAALLRSYNLSLPASRSREALLITALDVESAGVDRDTGAGIVMAYQALNYLASVTTPTPTPTPTPAPPPATVYYEIVARHSGKCLDVSGVSLDSGAQIIQWDCSRGANQQWRIVDLGDNYSVVIARHSGKQLDVSGASFDNGANAIQWDYRGNANQQWRIVEGGDGFYRITARHSGKCLDVSGVSLDSGARVTQWDCWGGANQQWLLRSVGP